MRTIALLVLTAASLVAAELPANRWTELRRDETGARRGSAIRYATRDGAFFLWGFQNADPELLQEQPLMRVPEYDVVRFDPAARRWQNHLPREWEQLWSKQLPLAYIPRAYAGITSGSERTVMRSPTNEQAAAPRPDLNIVFDQVAYRETDNSLYYFTGGLTARYDVAGRRWHDLRPRHSPPPVLGGSLAWNPVKDELVLFGGGHVAERDAGGKPRGYTGTWVYSFQKGDWRELPLKTAPPPRMNTRIVRDRKNQVLVLFGGDAQTSYLADTWLFDLETRRWRKSRATRGPAARAGHFTVWDPVTGYVIIGGGYNRRDLSDMWAYDAATDRWHGLNGETPTAFYLTADIAPEKRLIVLVANSRVPGDRTTCNVLFPVRTTYGYRIDQDNLLASGYEPRPLRSIAKRPAEAPRTAPHVPDLEAIKANRWVLLKGPGRAAPARTWGGATFDSDRERILYWGGGHCGYGGNDVDAYSVSQHTWTGAAAPDFPERAWNHGVRLAGLTFGGRLWTTHGRKVFAYDPAGKRMINVHPLRLTTGYEPAWLADFPTENSTTADALVRPPSTYRKAVTWSYDPDSREWTLLGPAPAGLDTLLTTPHGVVGIQANWRSRLNDSGYLLPWRPSDPPRDNALYLLRGTRWERIDDGGPSPQNLYEQTSLAYDSRRDRILLHGGGALRDELWSFDWKTGHWTKLDPKVAKPAGSAPPSCLRESVYLPSADVLLAFGRDPATRETSLWTYAPDNNAWRRVEFPIPDGAELFRQAGHNRGMVYDPKWGVVLLILGGRGDEGLASVFALRYHQTGAGARGR